jgi:23S rRNA (cytosine1962-C5)-methyltransferase
VFFRKGVDGEWRFSKSPEKNEKMDLKKWLIDFGGLKFFIKPTAFKHVGLFPEQAPNWDWMRAKITDAKKADPTREIEVLNLFAYTGGATLTCAQAGAKVVHIDGSKSAITWARENAEASGLALAPIRWILEDARVFVDPPAFGHGANKELWKIEEHLLPLIADCMKLLKPKTDSSGPLFFLVNGYSAGYSATAYENNLLPLKETCGGAIQIGELTIQESNKRLLPAGIFARWFA